MSSKIIVALDFTSADEALALVSKLDAGSCRVKVGKELFTREGPQFVRKLVSLGFDVFLDLKFHDIPNTVAKACAAAADLGVWMVNVHALGGEKMMRAAREAIDASKNKPLLIAVTILTSMNEEDVSQVGLSDLPADNVMRLAELARKSGMDGVVCSAQETALIHQNWPEGTLVTPGIRPSWAEKGDQVRIMAPAEAVASGSSYLVIGRPITGAADPMSALARIQAEI